MYSERDALKSEVEGLRGTVARLNNLQTTTQERDTSQREVCPFHIRQNKNFLCRDIGLIQWKEPPNKGHFLFQANSFVLCREVVPISEISMVPRQVSFAERLSLSRRLKSISMVQQQVSFVERSSLL